MSERERWIIYPLLFFALGSALRDKFLQHVSTKELTATEIVCEKITVTDPAKPNRVVAQLASGELVCEKVTVTDSAKPTRVVAQLASGTPTGGDEKTNSYGMLVLFDSEGEELCGVANNTLQVRHITAKEILGQTIAVVDPQNPQRKLALLTSTTVTAPDATTRRLGSLLLTDSEGAAIFGLANDQMQMRSISCQGIAITDPASPTRVLAALGSAVIRPAGADGPLQSTGVLQLNDQRFIGLRGNPTKAPFDAPPPPTQPADEATAETPPAAEPAPESTPDETGSSDNDDEAEPDAAENGGNN